MTCTGTNDTAASVRLTKETERTGADAVLLVTPYYNKPPQEGLYRHFTAIASTTKLVCEGEMMQVAHKGDWELREEEYLEIISRKTAILCGTCCRLGVECSSGADELARAMDDYGCDLGMAFQITDDLLDLVGIEGVVGKTLGRAFLQRKLTLPLIRARERLSDGGRKELVKLLRQARPEDLEQIREMVSDCGGLDSVQKTAQEYIERAVEKLGVLPAGAEREALEKMAGFVVARQV